MKLTEIKGEKAMETIADLIEPISVIVTDEKFRKLLESGNRVKAVQYLLRHHSKNVLLCMALLNDEDPETYEPNILTLPAMLIELLNTPELVELFTSGETVTSSGSPTESIEGEEK